MNTKSQKNVYKTEPNHSDSVLSNEWVEPLTDFGEFHSKLTEKFVKLLKF